MPFAAQSAKDYANRDINYRAKIKRGPAKPRRRAARAYLGRPRALISRAVTSRKYFRLR